MTSGMESAASSRWTDLGQKVEDVNDAQPEDLRLWSVTTILKALSAEGLIYWSAAEAAKAAVASRASLDVRIKEEGEEAVVKWLRDARFRRPKGELSSASLGTVAHAACEAYALGGERPDADLIGSLIRAEGGPKFPAPAVKAETVVIDQMLDRFDDWLGRFQPTYRATEVVVYHPTYGYAGTTDAFLAIDGVELIVDYKTSREPHDGRGNPKTPYPEAALQLAAYRYAESAAVWRPRRTEKFRRRYYLLSDAERDLAVPVPEVDGGAVIHLTPEHCEIFPARCDRKVFTTFLYVLESARWQFEESTAAIGTPMTPARGAR